MRVLYLALTTVLLWSASASAQTLLFEGVDVVPMDREVVLADRDLLVVDGRIAAIAARGEIEVPDGAERIDGGGRYLMPGLCDLHVHLSDPGRARALRHARRDDGAQHVGWP